MPKLWYPQPCPTPKSQKPSTHVKLLQFKILMINLEIDISSAPMVGINPFKPPSCHDMFCVFLKIVFAENKSALHFRYLTILVSSHLVFSNPVFYFLDKFSFKQHRKLRGEVEKGRKYFEAGHLFVKGSHSSLLSCCPGNTAPHG